MPSVHYDLVLLCMYLKIAVFSLFQLNVKLCLLETCFSGQEIRPSRDALQVDIPLERWEKLNWPCSQNKGEGQSRESCCC